MKTIIVDKSIIFTPKDSKTNYIIDFTLDRNYDSLEFFTSYSPKKVEDLELSKSLIEESLEKFDSSDELDGFDGWKAFLPLTNFVTLSIDFGARYLGCAHRHAPEQAHTISEKNSSPGFYMQKAEKGNWRAVLNVHALVTQAVDFHITIAGMGEETND